VLHDVVLVGVGCVLWWLVWLGLGTSPVSCIVCDVEGLCMTYNRGIVQNAMDSMSQYVCLNIYVKNGIVNFIFYSTASKYFLCCGK
jgi:hypothetical protein